MILKSKYKRLSIAWLSLLMSMILAMPLHGQSKPSTLPKPPSEDQIKRDVAMCREAASQLFVMTGQLKECRADKGVWYDTTEREKRMMLKEINTLSLQLARKTRMIYISAGIGTGVGIMIGIIVGRKLESRSK